MDRFDNVTDRYSAGTQVNVRYDIVPIRNANDVRAVPARSAFQARHQCARGHLPSARRIRVCGPLARETQVSAAVPLATLDAGEMYWNHRHVF